jgi:signal transduction histidine kinase
MVEVVSGTTMVATSNSMDGALRERLLQHCPVGICLLRASRVAFINPAGSRLLGSRSPADAMGRELSQLVDCTLPAKPVGASSGASKQYRRIVRRRNDGRRVVMDTVPFPGFRADAVLAVLRDGGAEPAGQSTPSLEDGSEAILQGERTRLARELHRDLSGVITALHWNLSMAAGVIDGRAPASPEITEAARLARMASHVLARVISGLHPEVLGPRRLWDSLIGFVKEFEQQFDLPLEMDIAPEAATSNLDAEEERVLLRTVQNVLGVMARRRLAQRIALGARREPQMLLIEIRERAAADDVVVDIADRLRELSELAGDLQCIGGSLLCDSNWRDAATVTLQLPVRSDG